MTPEQVRWTSYGVPADGHQADPQTLVFVAQSAIPPKQELEVRVQFPHGMVQAAPPSWQAEADREAWFSELVKRPQSVLDLGGLVPSLLVLVGGLAGLFALWYTQGRDAPAGLVPDYLPDLPDNLPPGAAGTLLDERPGLPHIIATLVDLARRGVIKMTEVYERYGGGLVGLSPSRDYQFDRLASNEPLRPYEQTILDQVFQTGGSVRLSALSGHFHTAIPTIRSQLYDEVVEAGFFRENPDAVRRWYLLVGILGLVPPLFIGWYAFTVAASLRAASVSLPAALAILSIGLIVISRVMPRKTPKGAEAAARWLAFARYLQDIDRYTDLDQAVDAFDKYLPYAIAFGSELSFIEKFAAIDTPAPRWYVGYAYDDSPSPEGHQAGRTPGPQEGADRGFRSLDSTMCDGLRSLLNKAPAVFSSSPGGSGDGGGWSGGWSGGGSSGGGGSGGGRGGFD